MSEIVLSPTVIDLAVDADSIDLSSEVTEISVDMNVTEIVVDLDESPIEVLVQNDITEVVVNQTPIVVELAGLTWTGTGGGSGGPAINEALARIEDVPSAVLAYVGEADPGAAPDDAVWRIKKITDEATGVYVRWANAGAFDRVWDDRATYVYN